MLMDRTARKCRKQKHQMVSPEHDVSARLLKHSENSFAFCLEDQSEHADPFELSEMLSRQSSLNVLFDAQEAYPSPLMASRMQ